MAADARWVERVMKLVDAYRAVQPETTDPHDLTSVDVARDEVRHALERSEHILTVVCREMSAYARAWRADWSDFDGRELLRHQVTPLVEWADAALGDTTLADYDGGTRFEEEHGG